MSTSSINQYLQAIQSYSSLMASSSQQQNVTTAATSTTQSSGLDTYESTISTSSAALPSETYSDIMELIKANKQAAGEEASAPTEDDFAQAMEQLTSSTIEAATETGEAAESGATAGGGSGSGSDDESETTTETVIGADGSVYLKTTTTSSTGEETVTIQKISDGSSSLFDMLNAAKEESETILNYVNQTNNSDEDSSIAEEAQNTSDSSEMTI